MDKKAKYELISNIMGIYEMSVNQAISRNVESARQLGWGFKPVIPDKDKSDFYKELQELLKDV